MRILFIFKTRFVNKNEIDINICFYWIEIAKVQECACLQCFYCVWYVSTSTVVCYILDKFVLKVYAPIKQQMFGIATTMIVLHHKTKHLNKEVKNEKFYQKVAFLMK